MTLFGRRTCEESEDFVVRVFYSEEGFVDISEQLTEKEAMKCLKEFKEKLLDKNPILEIEKDMGTHYAKKRYIFMKNQIRFVIVREI